MALADNKVTLRKRFPGIVHARMDVEPQLQPEALEFVTNALLRPALSMLSRSQLSTEAARVHVVGLVSDWLCVRACRATVLTIASVWLYACMRAVSAAA